MNFRAFFPALFLILPSFCLSADWPNWRGPNHDGISEETKWQADWPDDDPPIIWKAEVGIGFSSFAVADGRVLTTGNEDDQDTVWCFNADTGELIWKHSYEEPLDPKYYEGGTSATPTIDGDAVYQLSRRGKLFCLDAATGEVKWEKNVQQETNAALPDWGFAGSPLVHGELLVLNVGGSGLALNKANGEQVWFSDTDKAGYSTPLPFQTEEGDWIAIFSSARDFVARKLDSGEEIARHKWLTRYGVNASDPIVDLPFVFISSGYGKGCALLDVSSGEPVEVYKNKELQTQMNPAVLVDGHLYGCSGNQDDKKLPLKCVEMATGETKWAFPGIGAGSVKVANGHLIVLSARGELMFAPVSTEEFEPIFQMQVLGGKCWSAPVLANGRIYCRNAEGDVVCVDVRRKS